MIHAFTERGGIVCGLLFPSSTRLSSPQDMPTCDKVTTRLELVDCPACRKQLMARNASCANCGTTDQMCRGQDPCSRWSPKA